MIKMFTAFTEEIDDVEQALSELLEQVDADHNCLANSLGIIHCYSDFVDSGVVKALSEKLPFDTVGCTTMNASTPSGMSQMGLTLSVLTSGEVKFASGVSAPVGDSVDAPLTDLYNRISARLGEKPVMLMPFIPFLLQVGGDEFVEKLTSLSGGIPAFGTLSVSNEPDFSRCFTFYNGESYPASMVLAAFGRGAVEPEFLSVSVNEENILKQKAVITGIDRNILHTINNMPAVQYLESIGLAKNGNAGGIATMPFIIYLEDGSVLVRACFGANPEGSLILGAAVPVNSTFALATMEAEDVVGSTEDTITEALAAAKGRGLLMYSCGGRKLALGMKPMMEHEKAKECLGNSPYHFVYSGGEVFPSRLGDGTVVNHLQNDSLIICIL
jgi:hypothetical protein